jgi:hypothetical protein
MKAAMMAPVKKGAQQDCQDQQSRAQSDHAIGHAGGEAVFDNQGGQARNHQQQRQAVESVMAVVTMMMAVVAMPVMMVFMAMMSKAAPSGMAALIAGFVEREFITHPNIKFAHSISLAATRIGRTENIIIKSSNSKSYHQIIII